MIVNTSMNDFVVCDGALVTCISSKLQMYLYMFYIFSKVVVSSFHWIGVLVFTGTPYL